MSSTGSPTLVIDVGARRGEHRVVLATLLLVPLAILQLELSRSMLAAAAVLAVLAIMGGFWSIHWIGDVHRLTRIVCQSDGGWLLYEAGGRITEADLANATRISTHALWLCWSGRRLRPLLLLSGDVSAAEFRRLRVRLRVAPFRDPEPADDVL